MDPLSALLNFEESETEEEPPKEPKKKKKKKRRLTISGLKKQQAKLAEEARQQLIRQKQEFLRETKKRVQDEWQANHAKAQIYENEFETRMNQLNFSWEKETEIIKFWEDYVDKKREERLWSQYMDSGRLPDPSSVAQINSYLFVWTEIDKSGQMASCIKRTEEVMKLLRSLQEVIKDPGPDHSPNFFEDIRTLRNELRRLLQENIDRATFNLFSRIETDMIPINVTTSKYFAKCNHFQMSLWAELITPIPSSRGKEIRQPLKVTFEETDVVVVVPVSLLDTHKVMRSMWMSYDHWSDKCRTFYCPPYPSHYALDLYKLVIAQFESKRRLVDYRMELEEMQKKKVAELPPEPTLSQEILAWDSEPQRSLSDEIFYRECEEEDNLGRQVKNILNEYEVNLRERTFLGDLLLVEVIHQPPQPKYLRFKHSVTLRKEEPGLHQVDFYVKYPPPDLEIPDEETEDETVEEEIGRKAKMETYKTDLAEEFKKLAVIHLKPCQSVLWFEKPLLANWDPIHEYWSTEDIHDITYDEEDQSITFRTGRLGLMGLHVSRFCNIPFEDWILEGNDEDGANFFLKTSKTELNFKIREGGVCLESMTEFEGKTMDWILGIYYPPSELAEIMKKGGIDVFPPPDAAAYIENITPKHVVIEHNIYQVWGMFSRNFRFKRSKFNQLAKRQNIVFQAQEMYKDHQIDYCLIQTSINSSYILDIRETNDHYSSQQAAYTKSYIDPYSLIYQNCTRKARRDCDSMNHLLVQTIREFISYVRPLSFS